MNQQETDQFLDAYKRLENAAQRLVGSDNRSSAILRLAHHRDFEKYRDELDYCRQVRNLLTHEAKIDGQYGVYPSPSLQRFINKMLRLAEHPPAVGDRMTPVSRLLVARPADSVWRLMTQMKEQGFSHVPLLQSGVVTGMFSVDTVFQATLEHAGLWRESAVVGDFAAYLPIQKHRGNSYVFVHETMDLQRARDLFDKAYGQNKQIKLLLVTRRGQPEEKLLGVVSPYDLLEEE